MPKGTETGTDTLDTPAAVATDTAVSAPAAPAKDTEVEAGLQQRVSEASQPQAGVVATDNPQPGPEAPTETLLAGKYRTPEQLVDGYKSLERKLGEVTKYKQEAEMLKSQLAALAGIQGGASAPADQTPEWRKEWSKHPLSNMPDPRFSPKEYENWKNDVFTPHFLNDPAGAIQHFVTPMIADMREQMFAEFQQREQRREMEQAIDSFFSQPAPWTEGKPVREVLKGLPEQAVENYSSMVGAGVPPEAAAELVYHRFTTKQVHEQNKAIQSREAELRQIAGGSAPRGAPVGTPDTQVGEGASLAEMLESALKKQGVDLGDWKPIKRM